MVVGESKHFATGSEMPKINPDNITVYNMRFCPYAERVRLLLNLKKIPYDVININLKQKPEWFLQRNPLGKVPALELPGKEPLYESLICAEYLDEVYPGTKTIVPRDPYERARQKILIEVISQKLTGPFYTMLYKTNPNAASDMQKGLDELEAMLANDYFAGDSMGYVDLMVWPWFERLPAYKEIFGLDWMTKERYPKLMGWTERMLSDPDVKATTYPHEIFVSFLQSASEGTPKYDIGL